VDVMTVLRTTIRTHPLAVFVALTYLLSWTLVPFGGLLGVGPFLAALVVLAATEGRPGVGGLMRRIVQWRVHVGWYVVAIGLPVTVVTTCAFAATLAGAQRPADEDLAAWTEIPVLWLLFLLVPLFGAWEEPGFRGWALPHLGERHRALVAALLVGVIHVGFHLPLFLTGDIPLSDVVLVMAVSVVLAWLVLGSGGSVLLAMLMHATNNAVSGEFGSTLFGGRDADLFSWLMAGLWTAIAVVVALTSRVFRPPAGDPTSQWSGSSSSSAEDSSSRTTRNTTDGG
jgi:membrane protease YdiL (CAAX protease family)